MKKISEGAEAVIYETEINGISMLVKLRNRKDYREQKLDEQIRTSRTKKEAKLMAAALSAGAAAPAVAAVGKYSIFMEKLDGKLLKDTRAQINSLFKIGLHLAMIHNNGIVHGDFTAANILITKKGPAIIDFGLGSFSSSAEEKALDMLLMERSVSKSQYADFVRGYSSKAKSHKEVLSKLKEIKKRGRYQRRTLA